jgi:glucose-1-phosphate adenylyltransferase
VISSVLSTGVRINSHAVVENSILHSNVSIGRHCKISRAIIEQDIQVPEHVEIGQDLEADRKAGHFVTDSGIVVVHCDSPGVRCRKEAPPHSRNFTAEA